MITLRHRDVVKPENLEKKPCLPGVNVGCDVEEIETFDKTMQMTMLCLQCSNYINLGDLQSHRSFHEALTLFQYDIQNKPTNLDELCSQRAVLVRDLSKTCLNQSGNLKELGKIDLAYEIIKSEMYGRMNKARSNLVDHVDVKIRCLKKNLNDGISMGVCQSTNEKWKSDMEDTYSYVVDFVTNGAFFAVYDGYNGHTAAKKCANKLHGFLKDELIEIGLKLDLCENGNCQLSDCFQEAYKKMDNILLLGEEETSRNRWSGCSATTGVLYGQRLHVANAGNVKAFLIKKDTTIQSLTEDHTLANKREKRRMKKMKDIKKWVKPAWINEVASVTRGLGNHGDPILKLNAISSPGSCCVPLDSGCQIIFLGSSGFWEVFDENELLVLIQDWLELKQSEIINGRNGTTCSGTRDEDKTVNCESPKAVNVENTSDELHDPPSQYLNYSPTSKSLSPEDLELIVLNKEKDQGCQKCDEVEFDENNCKNEKSINKQRESLCCVSPETSKQPHTENWFSDLLEKKIAKDSCMVSMEMCKHLVNAALIGGGKSNLTVMILLCNKI